mmetsp:Transcript_21172/g.48862  ORF Transcript_21172/g.48862 Transcript_21172/m.48862 type:complete len:200 (-) Transcript_21172:77-676(-)|eukprot:CAMPEP_0116846170 /NCGR_PEP_ID=MMETSP0418-20121206/13685_1 /TAXON_ID=1158023 /ORGANISM="Astrosyne radiata, Strain 13vi08-1A" /LENGTH=199 /DNA_ID=CAMNT_0004477385 /DNA_START=22 /DNA_END=621 /DNA_ORIENTATION=-
MIGLRLLALWGLLMLAWAQEETVSQVEVDVDGSTSELHEPSELEVSMYKKLVEKTNQALTEVGDKYPDLEEDENGEKELLTEEEARNIALLLAKCREDTETQAMIQKMRVESKEEIQSVMDELDSVSLIMSIKYVWSQIKFLEVLFEDPKNGVEKMIEEGLVPEEHVELYRKDPKLLEEDTRKQLYVTFVTFAAAGGFL